MSEDRVQYSKAKYMYLVHSESRAKKYLFGNIKAVVTWFETANLFAHNPSIDYDRLVITLRKGNKFHQLHWNEIWIIEAIAVVGHSVKSSRKVKSAKVD